jgi:hypothetical protein
MSLRSSASRSVVSTLAISITRSAAEAWNAREERNRDLAATYAAAVAWGRPMIAWDEHRDWTGGLRLQSVHMHVTHSATARRPIKPRARTLDIDVALRHHPTSSHFTRNHHVASLSIVTPRSFQGTWKAIRKSVVPRLQQIRSCACSLAVSFSKPRVFI